MKTKEEIEKEIAHERLCKLEAERVHLERQQCMMKRLAYEEYMKTIYELTDVYYEYLNTHGWSKENKAVAGKKLEDGIQKHIDEKYPSYLGWKTEFSKKSEAEITRTAKEIDALAAKYDLEYEPKVVERKKTQKMWW